MPDKPCQPEIGDCYVHGLACIVVVPIDRKCDRLRRINPSAPYDKSKSLGSDGGGGMVARLET